jgi:hypothetical protein
MNPRTDKGATIAPWIVRDIRAHIGMHGRPPQAHTLGLQPQHLDAAMHVINQEQAG